MISVPGTQVGIRDFTGGVKARLHHIFPAFELLVAGSLAFIAAFIPGLNAVAHFIKIGHGILSIDGMKEVKARQ